MKNIFICIILAINLVSCAHTDRWSKTEKGMFTASTVLIAADCLQTRDIMSNPNYKETNPVMDDVGYRGVIPACLAGIGAIYIIADLLPSIWRIRFLSVIGGIEARCVYHNYRIGINFRY